jgi:flagellar protein FlgJ
MRQADVYFTAPAALAPTQATRPAASAVGGSASFGRVFDQVREEVADFIRDGAHGDTGATTLSAEGRLWMERSQGGRAVAATEAAGAPPAAQQEFLDQIEPWARETGQRLGVAPELVAAHAALESGWGQRPLRHSAGADSHNLFGLKADANWRGAATAALTTEYEGGNALRKTERFRSYPDQASAFRDYAQLLLDNPRYRAALNTGSDARAFAQGLARGGYATDPAYAEKLARLATRLQGVSE